MANLAPVPMRNMLVDLKTRLVESLWVRWFTALLDRVNTSPWVIGTGSTVASSVATSATDVDAAPLSGGLYRVSYSLSVIRAATVSSSMTPTIGWTWNGQSFSTSGAAMAGNTTTTQQNATFLLPCDASSSITYAVSYASVGATTAQYTFYVKVEQMP